jgi:hypothetical protein
MAQPRCTRCTYQPTSDEDARRHHNEVHSGSRSSPPAQERAPKIEHSKRGTLSSKKCAMCRIRIGRGQSSKRFAFKNRTYCESCWRDLRKG